MQDASRPITVAVLIATYNRAHLLPETLDSIVAQTRQADEIIVINDGSTDHTEEALAPYRDRIVYIKKDNGGKSSAVNIGLKQARSSHIWLFDDDDIALPNAIETHINFLSQHPEYDFSYSPRYYFSGKFSAQFLTAQAVPKLPQVEADQYLLMVLEDLRCYMPGMLIPLACYRVVGLFDEKLLRSQDHDMVIRLARSFRAGRIDMPTFAVRLHEGVRGPGFAQHNAEDRGAVWRRYQRMIYRRVLREFELTEYLPGKNRKGRPLTPEQTQRAFLQRAYILANKTLYDEALQDLEASAKIADKENIGSSATERRLFSSFTLLDDNGDIDPFFFYKRLGRIARRRRQTLKWLFRGIYWSCRKHGRRPFIMMRLFVVSVALLSGYVLESFGLPWGGASRPHEDQLG